MRKIAKEYVDNWNVYDNLLRDEWDSGDVRVYEFKDGPAQRSIGVTVNYKIVNLVGIVWHEYLMRLDSGKYLRFDLSVGT